MLAATVALASLFGWLARSAPEPLGVGTPAPVVAGAPVLAAPLVALEGALEAVTPGQRREVEADAALENVAATSAAPRRSTVCRGRLVDGGMRPISGVAIELWRVRRRPDGTTVEHAHATTRTTKLGEFTLRDAVGGGDFVVRAHSEGYLSDERPVPWPAEAAEAELELGDWSLRRFAMLDARVVLDEAFRRRSLYFLLESDAHFGQRRFVPVGEGGSLSWLAPSRGTYSIALSGKEWIGPSLPLWSDVQVGEVDDERSISLGTIDLQGAIVATTVRLVDEAGASISQASVASAPTSRAWHNGSIAAEDGTCHVIHHQGAVPVFASAVGYLDEPVECRGEPLVATLRRAPQAVFRVTVAGLPAGEEWSMTARCERGDYELPIERGVATLTPSSLGVYTLFVGRGDELHLAIACGVVEIAAMPEVQTFDVAMPAATPWPEPR